MTDKNDYARVMIERASEANILRELIASIADAFARDSANAAKRSGARSPTKCGPKLRNLAEFMDEAKNDVPACMTFPPDHWQKLHPTSGQERLSGEI